MRTRLLDVVTKQLQRLEARVSAEAEMTSADYEREARALSTLVRNFEALTGDDRASGQAGPGDQANTEATSAGAGERTPDDEDTFRRDIAARLVRLRKRLDDQRE